jgi:hypothetical protein
LPCDWFLDNNIEGHKQLPRVFCSVELVDEVRGEEPRKKAERSYLLR